MKKAMIRAMIRKRSTPMIIPMRAPDATFPSGLLSPVLLVKSKIMPVH